MHLKLHNCPYGLEFTKSDQDKMLHLELSTLFVELGHVPLDSS